MLKKETSYGIIPLRKHEGKWQALLVRHGKGHWSFPKGHPEEGEEPRQAAARELEEETGLKITSFIDLIPTQNERYQFHHHSILIDKTVVYFAAEVEGTIALQEEEISDFRWLDLKAASAFATFPQAQHLCMVISSFLEP